MPDGFNGAIMAVESIGDAIAFLHGPGGCRIRHMVHSCAVLPRMEDGSAYVYKPYFNGYQRVPATYLDEYDFINGAMYKLEEGHPIVQEAKPSLVVVIDSPGAALIGDDHRHAIRELGLEDRAIFMDSSLVSLPMPECYGRTLRKVLEFISPQRTGVVEGGFNLLGLSIVDKDWAYALEELRGICESMGLTFVSAPGAGASLDDMRKSVNAEYNVVICPEFSSPLLEFYEPMGVKTVKSPAGAPVGFDAVEAWIRTIAEATGKDPAPALEMVQHQKRKVLTKFLGMKYNSLRIRGLTFSIAGIGSVVRPLTEWLYNYMGMAPLAVVTDEGSDETQVEALRDFLVRTDFDVAFGKEPIESDVVLCEGITALTMEANGTCLIGIPIGHSSMGLDDVIPRPVYGLQGSLYILDELLHGVRMS